MRVEHRRWFSGNLGHDMELIIYGHAGQPLICFPSHNGRMADWEGFGMVDCVGDLIEAGRLMMIAVDGIDWQSWTNKRRRRSSSARGATTTTTATSPKRSCPWLVPRPVTTASGRPAAAWAPSTRRTSSSAGRTCSTA